MRVFTALSFFVITGGIFLTNSPYLFAENHGETSDPIVLLTPSLPSAIKSTNLAETLTGLFNLSIAAAGVLAVIMIAIAGIQYMGTDAYSSKEQAKERIRGAVLGVIIILSSVLFLETINPDIVSLRLVFQQITPAGEIQGLNPSKLKGAQVDPIKWEVKKMRTENRFCFSSGDSSCCKKTLKKVVKLPGGAEGDRVVEISMNLSSETRELVSPRLGVEIYSDRWFCSYSNESVSEK